ncbi:MAG TPA: DNA gyrase modulator [Chitinophagaceae bacterium]|nr:DNA gyrase modulator [Chitinophagaceae bacterium]
MVNRKKFIRLATVSFGSLMVPGLVSGVFRPPDPDNNKLSANIALDAARRHGASYADVRIGHYASPGELQSHGICIRVLVNGKWGYAATSSLVNESITQCAAAAVVAATEQQHSKIPQRHQYDLKIKHDHWSVGVFN